MSERQQDGGLYLRIEHDSCICLERRVLRFTVGAQRIALCSAPGYLVFDGIGGRHRGLIGSAGRNQPSRHGGNRRS
ncbi:hypothetical protein D3C72_2393220 [compost metagenome]